MSDSPLTSSPGGSSSFPQTRWSLVLRVQGRDEDQARQAMGELCHSYWFPLYAHARRRGLDRPDAEDATQAFFLKLLELDSLQTADRDKGRLRSFLLGAMSRFLAQQWRKNTTLKRGGACERISMDLDWAENRLALEIGGAEATEADFDRSWAFALINRVFDRLRDHYRSREREPLFDALKGSLTGDGDYGRQAALSEQLDLSEKGVRSAVHQMRRRFRDLLEEEVRETVANEAEVREEIGHLCRILAESDG